MQREEVSQGFSYRFDLFLRQNMPGEQRRLSLKAQTKGGGLFLMSIFTHFFTFKQIDLYCLIDS